MNRLALVVGINNYDYQPLSNLKTPAEDAEAIAILLTEYGNFQVQRLPWATPDHHIPNHTTNPSRVTLTQLESALVQMFYPEDHHIDTALLYFSGYALHKDLGIPTSFLSTTDVNPKQGNWGLSLAWLCQLLQNSPVRQQIIWLDCYPHDQSCNLSQADPGYQLKGRPHPASRQDRCFIATCEQQLTSNRLTKILLTGLDPTNHPDHWVTNYTLIDFINQASIPQPPIFTNSGAPILLTASFSRMWSKSIAEIEDKGSFSSQPTNYHHVHFPANLPATNSMPSVQEDICPYKGLSYFDFNNTDPKYFYGRTALTDQLLERVRQGNFIAILGASGTGKSSLLRAGLIHQLKLGQRLSGTQQWRIYIFRPGEHPRRSLALALINPELAETDRTHLLAKTTELIQMGGVGLAVIIKALAGEGRVVLAIDQFEDVFTLCQDQTERQQFFACLLEALEKTDNKLCLAIAMRTDVLDQCAERDYAGLSHQIQAHLVTMTPMNREELRDAIIEPARLVGLEVEPGLVAQILTDLQGSANLPLLQYTLTELWQRRPVNKLMLAEYARLGGIQGAMHKRANLVYQSLSTEEQEIAKGIFLELTQLSQEIQGTRQQVLKESLITKGRSLISQAQEHPTPQSSFAINPWSLIKTHNQPQTTDNPQPTILVEQVLHKLVDARLLVTGELQPEEPGKPTVTVVDIAHQSLIRDWSRLHHWLHEKQEISRIQRQIEEAAQEWLHQDKLKKSAFLLTGLTLAQAENYLQHHSQLKLSRLAQEFLHKSLQNRTHQRLLQVTTLTILIGILSIISVISSTQWRNSQDLAQIETLRADAARVKNLLPVEPLQGLLLAIEITGESQSQFQQVDQDIKSSLVRAIEVARESNVLRGHKSAVSSVAFSPDGQTLVTGSYDHTLRLWDQHGQPIGQPLQGDQDWVSAVAFSPDGQTIVSSGKEGKIRLWNRQGQPIGKPFQGQQGWITSVAFSPDGQTIASGGQDGTLRLWNRDGQPIGERFRGHKGVVFAIAFSPDGQTIASGSGDGTIRLWNRQGQSLGKLGLGHEGVVFAIAFSPDGQTLVSGGRDGSVRLWNRQGQPISEPFRGHQGAVFAIAFSPDGQTIVSGSADRTVRLWNRQGQPLAEPWRGHQGAVLSVAFSPDGQAIASGSRDGTVRLWDWQHPVLNHSLQGRADWLSWLKIGCDRLRYHPIFKSPQTPHLKSRTICQEQVWEKD